MEWRLGFARRLRCVIASIIVNHQNQDIVNRTYRLLLLTGLLTALALRLYRLGLDSLWYDETVSAYLSSLTPQAVIRHTAGDIHPPLYYLMVLAWRAISHPSLNHGLEYLLGWPSLVWGMLVVALIYPLGRKLLDRRSALIALWLAAVNPFHVWYSQEVRMYTMGAALGLLCLWVALKWRESASDRWIFLALYAGCAVAGLYTLYYFALLLLAVNLIVVLLLWQDYSSSGGGFRFSLLSWLTAQISVLLVFSPWLPVLWKQATDPPVPPWRQPWDTLPAFIATFSESLSALLAGQALLGGTQWIWAFLTLAATAIFIRSPSIEAASYVAARRRRFDARVILLSYVFMPIGMLYIATLLLTPVYHVRYLFTYAPLFMLILASAVSLLWKTERWLGISSLVFVIGISMAGLQQTWFNPLHRADDHRTAVADLAENWRPGDLILVNAGWAYTALDTYWPQQVHDPHGSRPPQLAGIWRFNEMPTPAVSDQPVVAMTGSVDGEDSLGWSDPESDFFAVDRDETIAALDAMARDYARIWHYRIYDTVNDPTATIRSRLAENAGLVWESAYAGRDYLRVQLFDNHRNPPGPDDTVASTVTVDFGDMLRLTHAATPISADAGEKLYVELEWLPLPPLSGLETGLAMSLRLYDWSDKLIAQSDGPPLPPTPAWRPGKAVQQPLALDVPAAARPGSHKLELVVYRQDDGVPIPLPETSVAVDGQRLQLGPVDVLPAEATALKATASARFDYIDLIEASVAPDRVAPDGEIRVDLVWQPRPNGYRDNYVATVALLNENENAVGSWSEPLGGAGYPSGQWPTAVPVMETRRLRVPESISAGDYAVVLSVERASDSLPIRARKGRLPVYDDRIELGNLTVD
jgi:mannosyltransferase